MTIDAVAVGRRTIDVSAASITATPVRLVRETIRSLAQLSAILVFYAGALEASEDGASRRIQRAVAPGHAVDGGRLHSLNERLRARLTTRVRCVRRAFEVQTIIPRRATLAGLIHAPLPCAALGISDTLTARPNLIDLPFRARELLDGRRRNADVASLITRSIVQGVALHAAALAIGIAMADVRAVDMFTVRADTATHASIGLEITHRRIRFGTVRSLSALHAFAGDTPPVALDAVFVSETRAARRGWKNSADRCFRLEFFTTATIRPCVGTTRARLRVTDHALLVDAERFRGSAIGLCGFLGALDATTSSRDCRVLSLLSQTIRSLAAASSVGETRYARASSDITDGALGVAAIIVGGALHTAVRSFAARDTNRARGRAPGAGVDVARDAQLVHAQCVIAVAVATATDATIAQRIATLGAPRAWLRAVFVRNTLHTQGHLGVANASVGTTLLFRTFEHLVARVCRLRRVGDRIRVRDGRVAHAGYGAGAGDRSI